MIAHPLLSHRLDHSYILQGVIAFTSEQAYPTGGHDDAQAETYK